jgi:hypothetical protein
MDAVAAAGGTPQAGLVTTKWGFKARLVTQAQEDAIERLYHTVCESHGWLIDNVKVPNSHFGDVILVYVDKHGDVEPCAMIAADGEMYLL